MQSRTGAFLIKNTMIYAISDIIVKSIPFLMLPVITSYLNQDEYGMLALFNNLVEIMTVIILLGANAFFRVEFFKGRYDTFELLAELFLGVKKRAKILSILNIIIIVIFFRNSEYFWFIIIPMLAWAKSIISVFMAYYQCKEKPLYIAKINISQAAINASLTVLFFLCGWGIEGRYFGIFFSVIVVSLTLLVIYSSRVKIKYKNSLLSKKSSKFGLGLLPYSLSWWLRTGADTYVILYFLGAAVLGEFSIITQLSMVLLIVTNSINQGLMPTLYRFLSNNEFKRYVMYCIACLGVVLFVAISYSIVGQLVIDTFINDSYSIDKSILDIMLISIVIKAITEIFGSYLYFHSKTSALSMMTAGTSILHLTLSAIFANAYGLIGVAYASIISFSVLSLIMLTYIYKSHEVLCEKNI